MTIKKHLSKTELAKRVREASCIEEQRRWQVILLRQSQPRMAVKDVALTCGVAYRTVTQWTWGYNKHGPKWLEVKPRGGRRRGLMSLAEEKEFMGEVFADAPSAAHVTAARVRAAAEKRLGHPVPKDYAYDLFWRHGWRKVMPRTEHPKRNKQAQEDYKKKIPEILASAAKTLGCAEGELPEVWFEDEAFFGRMSNPVPCWAPPGVRPVLPLQRQREYRNVFGAVCPASGAVFTRIAERNNAELMSAFLAELSASRKESRMVVFLDGASWHKSKDLAIPDNIVIEVLPPYSPELNPAEALWKYVRTHYTHNQAWESLADVDASLAAAFAALESLPETVRSFSLYSWLVYD